MTRHAVAAAARHLFAARGYVATSIQAISDMAQIPVPTIYSAFGAKPAILEEVRRNWIHESQVESLYQEAMTLALPRERLRRAAHWTRKQFELGHDVIAVYQEAARADSRVATTWQQALRIREAAVAELIASCKPDLRARLSRKDALDIYVACTLPEAYRTLVIERGWSADRYEAWLAGLLVEQVLGP